MEHKSILVKEPDGFLYPKHGGNRRLAALVSGLEPAEILDFSITLNPLGPPDCVNSLLAKAFPSIQEYPDPESTELKSALSFFLETGTEKIIVTNGSTELIYQLPVLFDGKKSVLLVNPCFSEYEQAFRLASIPLHNIFLDPSLGFELEINSFLFQLNQIPNLGGVVLGNPGSPTGNLWQKEALLALLSFCERREIYLIIDETFIEFAGKEYSLVEMAAKNRFLIVVRSLTKFFSLPGLRLGYGVMSPDITRKIEAHRPPWSVNSIAQKIGCEVLKDKDYIFKSREFVRREVEFLYSNLKQLERLEVFPTAANFLLFHFPGMDEKQAEALYKAFLRCGMMVRNCGNFAGLDHSYFRVAARKRKENILLRDQLKKHIHLLHGN